MAIINLEESAIKKGLGRVIKEEEKTPEQVKTRRGVYIDLKYSDIITYSPNGQAYRFSSLKKQEMFNKRVKDGLDQIDKLQGKIYKIVGDKVSYDMTDLKESLFSKVYDEMEYK